jgi:hypothetical protein
MDRDTERKGKTAPDRHQTPGEDAAGGPDPLPDRAAGARRSFACTDEALDATLSRIAAAIARTGR